MRARTEELQQEDNAFKALQAAASTTLENYKDETYQSYRETHDDVPDKEREFFKTLTHFQNQSLQIFERKQTYIQHLEEQVKAQEGIKRALEEARQRKVSLQQ